MMSMLNHKPNAVDAFDIRWSHIYKGTAFSQEKMGKFYHLVTPSVSDINENPQIDKSVKITAFSHTLEPNGGNLKALIRALFSITVDKFILFEPGDKINNEEGKKRMGKRGHIKNSDGIVAELGGEVIEKVIIKNIAPPLNPTVCFVIVPPSATIRPQALAGNIFPVLEINTPLQKIDKSHYSDPMGQCYSELKYLPRLKSNCAILATALAN